MAAKVARWYNVILVILFLGLLLILSGPALANAQKGLGDISGDMTDLIAIFNPDESPLSNPIPVESAAAAIELWDNGSLVNCSACGFKGADESNRQNISLGMTTFGFSAHAEDNNWVTDDFTISAIEGWTVENMTFYAYQPDSTIASTIHTLHVRIWDGPPDGVGSKVIWGSSTKNLLAETGWTNIYRGSEDTSGSDTSRPVMYASVNVDHFFPQGIYWVDWQLDGSLLTGPYVPPVTLSGQTVTGNGRHSTDGGVTYSNAVDRGTRTQQGFPFIIQGSIGLAAISLDTTVTTDIGFCPGEDELVIDPGDQVTYCYEVLNTGTITLSWHSLVDSHLGPIFDGLPHSIAPGETVGAGTSGIVINSTTVSTATWTSYNPGPVDVAVSSDTSRVYVRGPFPVVCNGPVIEFNAGLPTDWTAINNASSNPVTWTQLADCGETENYTGGSGNAACASSNLQEGGSGLYDTELRTAPIDLSWAANPQFSYRVNYQNFATADHLEVDVSTNGGSTWDNLLDWNEDHGGFRSVPGEMVTLDLSAYAGEANLIVRWHYYDPTGPVDSVDWYVQVDDVQLTCEEEENNIWLPIVIGGP